MSKYITQHNVEFDAWSWGGGKAEGEQIVTFGKPGQLTLVPIGTYLYVIKIKTPTGVLTAEDGVFITRDKQGDFSICGEQIFYQIARLAPDNTDW